jgi:transposase
LIFADAGYSGKLIKRIKKTFCIDVQIIKRKETNKFKVLPKSWIVERTFAWLDSTDVIQKIMNDSLNPARLWFILPPYDL